MAEITGDRLVIRDFNGELVDTIRIRADGMFLTGSGMIEPDRLGQYVLQVCRHPARSDQAKPVV